MATKPRRTLKESNQGQYRSNRFSRECNNGHWRAPNALLQLAVEFPGVALTKVLFRPAAQSGSGVKPVPEARLNCRAAKAMFCPTFASFSYLSNRLASLPAEMAAH